LLPGIAVLPELTVLPEFAALPELAVLPVLAVLPALATLPKAGAGVCAWLGRGNNNAIVAATARETAFGATAAAPQGRLPRTQGRHLRHRPRHLGSCQSKPPSRSHAGMPSLPVPQSRD